MKYEWDEAKNQKNFAKHGLTFEMLSKYFPDLASPSKTTVLLTEKSGSLL
jgi:uncharacterized DUF497 family protein